MIVINLPILNDYPEFINAHEKNIKGVYKLTFECGSYYIGRTINLYGRIYNHCTMKDIINCKNLSDKHKRMKEAIEKKESVYFELIDSDPENERLYTLKNIDKVECLNMKV